MTIIRKDYMTRLEVLGESHMQSRAAVAWRMAGGDYRAALGHLEAMAGADTSLAAALHRAGLVAALRVARGNRQPVAAELPPGNEATGNGTLSPQERRTVAQTGGLYRAHHQNEN